MKLLSILQITYEELDNLYDYYNNQVDKLARENKKEINRFIPGFLLNEFFSYISKGYKTKEIPKEIVNIKKKYIKSYKISSNKEYISYSYKDNVDTTKFETNLSKAAHELRKIQSLPDTLNKSILMMMVVKFEQLLREVMEYVTEKHPEAYVNDKTLTYKELMEMDICKDSVNKAIISKQINELMWENVDEWYKYLGKLKIDIHQEELEFKKFTEIYYRRNIFVHNFGIVNSAYIKNVPKELRKNISNGSKIYLDKNYINDSISTINKCIYKIIFLTRKVCDDAVSLEYDLSEIAFNHMIKEQWDISEYIYKMLLMCDDQDKMFMMYIQYNYWISIKNQKRIDEIINDVKALDTSALTKTLVVAKYAILDNHKEVSMLLPQIIGTEIGTSELETWPLFIQYRKSEEYKKFKVKYKDLLSKFRYDKK